MLDDQPTDDWLACVDEPLDVGSASAWVVLPSCGAAVTFQGTVRDHSPGHDGVERLEYEAYEEYVLPVLAEVVAEARRAHPDLGRVVVWHRVGALELAEVAVVVAVSAPHRGEAFAAAREVIDEVKARAPIWKREISAERAAWGVAR